ncbi:MAG: SLC13 family permease [Candidatus Nanopelagicales bacterium]
MSDALISMLILAVVVGLFVWNKLPVELVAVGTAIALYFSGVITLQQSLAGFGDAAVILIAALFVVSEGLDSTGVTSWIGQLLSSKAGGDRRRLIMMTMLLCAALSGLIGLNGAVAALLPMAVVMSVRNRFPTSKLLMPLAFAGSAGGLLLLTGSPVNVVISEAASSAGVGAFSFFDFTLVGIPAVIGTIGLTMVLGAKLLPERSSDAPMQDLSGHAKTLIETYSLDNILHLRVSPESDLLGQERSDWDLSGYPGINVITVVDREHHRPTDSGQVAPGDRVTVIGDPPVARHFAAEHGMSIELERESVEVAGDLLSRESGAVEVVIPPRSPFMDEVVRPGTVLSNGHLVVLAVQREGHDRGARETQLQVGDVMLVEGDWEDLETLTRRHDLLMVDAPDLVRRQAVPLGPKSSMAIGILLVMVVLLATGIVPSVMAAMVAACAMIVGGVLTPQQAYRGISWSTVLLVAGMMPMSTAITVSGAGDMIANKMVDLVGGYGPVPFLAALVLLTAIFGQLISNTATALVMIPIAVSASNTLGISPRPVLMAVCVMAAAAFLTPVATAANMMVMGPGGYKFTDYWRLGLALLSFFFVLSVGLVPLIWSF